MAKKKRLPSALAGAQAGVTAGEINQTLDQNQSVPSFIQQDLARNALSGAKVGATATTSTQTPAPVPDFIKADLARNVVAGATVGATTGFDPAQDIAKSQAAFDAQQVAPEPIIQQEPSGIVTGQQVSTGVTEYQPTIPFTDSMTEGQRAGINQLVSSGRAFTETDARNFAFATGDSNWQKYVGLTGQQAIGDPTAPRLEPTPTPDGITPSSLEKEEAIDLSGTVKAETGLPESMAMVAGAGSTLEQIMANLTPPETEADQKQQSFLDQMTSLIGDQAQKGADQLTAEQSAGLPELRDQFADINAEILTRSAEYNVLQTANQNKPITMNSIIGSERQILNAKAADIGLLQAQAQGLQGKIQMAQDTVNRAIDLKYSSIDAKLNIYQAQLQALQPTLNKEEKIQAQAQQVLLDRQRQANEEAKAQEKNIQSVMLEAISAGITDPNVLSQISGAKSYTDAIQTLGTNMPQQVAAGLKSSDVDISTDEFTGKRTARNKVTGEVLWEQDSSGQRTDSVGGFIPLKSSEIRQVNKDVTSSEAFKGLKTTQDTINLVNNLDRLFGEMGTERFGEGKAILSSAYNQTLIGIKELFNLGVLAGPDMDIINSVINDPTKTTRNSKVQAGIDQMKSTLARRLSESYKELMIGFNQYDPAQVTQLNNVSSIYNTLVENDAEFILDTRLTNGDATLDEIKGIRQQFPNADEADIIKILDQRDILGSTGFNQPLGTGVKGLGTLSEKYESGGDPGVIGFDRTGGYSYGKYQLAHNNAQLFVRESPYKREFQGLRFNSPEWRNKWKEVARRDPQGFGDAQQDYIAKTHFNPQIAKLGKAGANLSRYSNVLKDVVWSTAVQHGANTSIIVRALKAVGKNADEAALIKKIYDLRWNGGRSFASSTKEVKRSVFNRFFGQNGELKTALNNLSRTA